MADVGVISAKITADTSGFDDAVDKTEKGAKKAGKSLSDLGKQARETANTMGKWAAATVAAAATVGIAITKHNLAAIKELKNLSQAAGISTAAFQRMAFAAKDTGIENEKLSQIFLDMNDRIGDFARTGGGPLADFFDTIGPKVGVTIDDFKRLSGPEALQLYVSSLEKANASQADMSFFLESISGDAVRLLPLLRDNGKAMSEGAEAAKALGIGLSEIEVQNAIEAQKAIDRVTATLEAQTMRVVADLAPAIELIADELLTTSKEFDSFGITAIGVGRSVGKAIGVMADGFRGLQAIGIGIQIAFQGLKGGVIAIGLAIRKFVISEIEKAADAVGMLSNAVSFFGGAAAKAGFQEATKSLTDFVKNAKDENLELEQSLFSTTEKIQSLKDEFDLLAAESMPSESIDSFFSKLENAILESRQKIKDEGGIVRLKDFLPDPSNINGQGGEGTSAADQYQMETIGLLEAMGLRFSSVEEMQLAENQRELDLLNDQLRNKEISHQEHEDRVAEIKRNSAEIQRTMLKDQLQDGFKLLSQSSSKVEKLMKGVAIAQALIKGKQAAVDAWQAGMSTGGPFAPVVAAAYTAASLAKTGALINSIKGGGKGSGGSVAPALPAETQAAPAQQSQQQPNRTFNVNMVGTSQNTEAVRDLLGMINEQASDGLTINTGG